MCAEFWGDADGTFFNYEAVSKNRRIENAWLPDHVSVKLPSATKLRIPPKQNGEKRILSVDVALMASTKHKNDASALFINQLLPTKSGRYMNNIMYAESNEGFRTEQEALTIRKMYEEFSCDYLVLDVKNFGLSIYDALAADIIDPETGEVYPPLSCCNNEDLAARCIDPTIPESRKVIWAISGSSKFNSDCAIMLREGFRSGYIRLLISEMDVETQLNSIKGFQSLSVQDKMDIMMPYINTTMLISELINLQHEESNGMIRITERSNARKDRYSSLSYNYWVALQLEKRMRRDENISLSHSDNEFIFKAPRRKNEERW